MYDWTNVITIDLLVECIIPYSSCIGVELLFITEKRIYEAMKQKEYSYRIWHTFWKRTESYYRNVNGHFLEENSYLWKELYKDGKLEGEQLAYHTNGQLAYQRFYKDGLLTNTESLWDNDGYLSSTVEYKDGKVHGRIFDDSCRDGTHSTEIWEDGKELYALDEPGKLAYSYIYDDNGRLYRYTSWTRNENGIITHTSQSYRSPITGRECEYKRWVHIGKDRQLTRHVVYDENSVQTVLVHF